MKRIDYILILIICCAFTLQSCSDFFDTNPKNIINDDEYITNEDEMYKGFLGIFTRMQEAGDQSIFLTDTRCNFLEVTSNAPIALQDIYNYNSTEGNEYANPTCYYSIVIACNDFMNKMEEYHKKVGSSISEQSETNFKALVSSAVRIKVWAYYMLGRIYGQAYWFDDPMTEIKDLSNTAVFTKCDMKSLVEKCINLLDNGVTIDGIKIESNLIMNWTTWLDQENQDEKAYRKWQYLTPPFLLMRAELLSWRCNYEDESAAQSDWTWIRDNLLQYMYNLHNGTELITGVDPTSGSGDYPGYIYQTNIPLQSAGDVPYYTIFCSEEVGNKYQLVSGIMYDYDNHQRNRLVQYLCPAYPGEGFYLRPSSYGKSLYNDDDLRSFDQKMVMNTLNGEECVTKYYYSYNHTTRTYHYIKDNIFEIEPTIITFRGHDYHFLLAEAENHLGNWHQSEVILNMGITNEFANKVLPASWSTYYKSWFCDNGGYGDVGIVGCCRGTVHKLPTPEDKNYNLTEDQRKKIYDWAIADEYLKEYTAEGKSYSYLCKMAERYATAGMRDGDKTASRDSVAARIAPKYTSESMRNKVRSYIGSNGYWIQWNLLDSK